MGPVVRRAGRFFDLLEGYWSGPYQRRILGPLLVGSFLGGLAVIEANRLQLLPFALGAGLPTNHFHAVGLAFTLLLFFEVVSLVFSLARSVSTSLGKQFEIFSLILLRQTFEEFTHFSEPVEWDKVRDSITRMAADVAGALLIFVALGFFYVLQRHRPITRDAEDQAAFVSSKKLIALVLLVAFLAIGAHDAWRWVTGGEVYAYFGMFYTVLIFSDVLLVLVSIRTASTFRILFRNSGFAVATVFLRLALSAPPFVNAALGVLAAGIACGLTVAYNAFEFRAGPDEP